MIVSSLQTGGLRLAFVLGLAACSSQTDFVPLVDPGRAAGTEHRVLVATNRLPDTDAEVAFSGERAGAVSFSDVDVWVPADRVPGEIAYPDRDPDVSTQFATTGSRELEGRGAALAALNTRLAAAGRDQKIVFIFVHGYNVSYAGGLYRQAQMIEDFRAGGVGLLFSWPSAGRLLGYVYDRDSVQYAREDLADVIALAAASDAESVFLLGHSMGTLLVMEAVRHLSLTNRRDVLSRISPLVLAAPDIDVNVFERQLASLDPRPDPMLVFVSERDGALQASQVIRGGHPRLGEGTNIQELQENGITVIDLTTLDDGDRIGHTTFASSPELIRIFGDIETMQTTINDAGAGPVLSPIDQLRVRAGNLIHPAN
ncbi:MAG: alpha/beta fold hydrolase [Pseudomonadota bacterium]